MVMLAGEWWQSGTFWAAAAVIVTGVAAIGAVWATLRAANPKRRLLYRVYSCTPLLNPTASVPGGTLTVMHGTNALAIPWVVEIQLINAGRRDIVASMFHNGDSIVLDLGVPIVALLRTATSSRTQRPPAAEVDGGVLTVPPCLLVKRHTVTFSVLVDGADPQLECLAPLTDIDVAEGRRPVSAAATVAEVADTVVPGPLGLFSVLAEAILDRRRR
ncbi:hypothetical protein ACFV80_25620 [Streptomyces sp. NPDC059862]|uniref:hypothetical protein n=1 Tax=Streptomyces sp. NPDC059862 TaxID=3346975 RepID=UPI0036592F78